MMKREGTKEGVNASSQNSRAQSVAVDEDLLDYDCLICTNAIDIFGIFDCGHYCCAICAMRIYKYGKTAGDRCCPMCRNPTKHLRVVQSPPMDEYQFDMEEIKGKAMYHDKILKVSVESKELRDRLEKLYNWFCPQAGCWDHGFQDPFQELRGLKEHLSKEHKLRYCKLCLEHRPSFLCEQVTYSDNEYDSHNRGKCSKDPPSFLGHPMCLWCRERFYDGDSLLKHMQSSHFSCDVCNRGEFTFVFYKNRNKLLDHFDAAHVLCNHVNCVSLDPMLRVFASDLELVAHQQKNHGATTKSVSLDALGFSYGGPNHGRSSRPPAAGPPLAGGLIQENTENPATGRDVSASIIWFDNVQSGRESVNMMPQTKHRTTNADVKAYDDNDQQLASQVIPAHFESQETLDGVKRIQTKIKPAEPPAVKATPIGLDGKKIVLLADDLSPEAYNSILKEKLPTFLTKKEKFEEFKKQSSDFLGNKLMATEYYTKLASYFFTAEQLEQIFEPLAYSLSNTTKRAALIAARKMMTSKESHARIEEERKAHEEAAVLEKRNHKQENAGWKRLGSAPPTATAGKKPLGSAAAGAKPKKNVWSQKGQERVKPSMEQDNFAMGNPMPASLLAPPVAPVNPAHAFSRLEQHTDPEKFPSLAQDTVTESNWGRKKSGKPAITAFNNNSSNKKGPLGSQPELGSAAKKAPAAKSAWFRE